MKKLITLFVAAVFAFCLLPMPTIFAEAGFSYKTHVTDKTIEKEISLVEWSYSRDITHTVYEGADGKKRDSVLFGQNGTPSSYLNVKTKVENLADLGYEDCIEATFMLSIDELPENVRFGFSIGLKNYLSAAGTPNSAFVYLTKVNDGIALNVSTFTAVGDETSIISSLPLANAKDANGWTNMGIDVASNGGILVTVNGVKAYENVAANLPTVGYVGFSQTGAMTVHLLSVEVVSLAYDKPTTGVGTEGSLSSMADFSNDEFNINEWFCSSIDGYYGGGMYIENGKLVYDNVSETVFSTTHQYSNFSLEVELNDLQREAELDGKGNIIRPISTYIGFAFGRVSSDHNVQAAHNVSQFLYIDPRLENFKMPAYATSVRFRTGGREDEPFLLPSEYNFWNNDIAQDRSMFIRLSVIDGMITLELKYDGSTDYEVVYTRYLGYTPLGYVQIWTTGHGPDVKGVPAEMISATSFTLDNLSITNKDNDPSTRVVSFATNKLVVPSDFPYVDTWDDGDLIQSNWDGVSAIEDRSGLYIGLIVTGGVVVAVLVAGVVFMGIKKRKQK